MAKPKRQVSLAIETAHSGLTVLSALIEEKMHADDRKQIDALIAKVRDALDAASSHLSDAIARAEQAIDEL